MLAERQLALAAAALLGGVVGVAVAARHDAGRAAAPLPQPAIADVGRWYTALAGVRARPIAGQLSGCGTVLKARTLGVAHPVLPCGVEVFIRYGRKTVLTDVVDRGPLPAGRQFELTPALARLMGLSGVRTIRWSFARAG